MSWLSRFSPQLLSVLRIMSALLFISHGSAKLLHFPPIQALAGVSPASPFGILGLFELLGGVLVLVGFYSRWVAFLLSGEMAVAYFVVHAPQNFFPMLNQGEAAIFFCFVFLYLAAAGPGPIAVNQK